MGNSPSIPKGTRDFNPVEMTRRNYIFNTIKSIFRLYGYQPIETPAMENLSSLLGKYGEEGDKLLFRILNSGNFLSKISDEDLTEADHGKISGRLSEKGLRYDLTVPFARYVVQHRNEINFPFKRYQIQPVWRADRPQKGRYREFYQCDVDVIGSDSLYNEYELIQIINKVFSSLKIRNSIKINNRKILAGISEIIGEKDRIIDITIAIDKLEKIGIEKVNLELRNKGISESAIQGLQPVLFLEGSVDKKLEQLDGILAASDIGLQGVEEMRTMFAFLKEDNMESQLEMDLTLARGLNYYTGAIIEVKALDVSIGSICGGGRYDDLAGVFGMPGVSGVGVSFGADRIYDVLNQLNLFPESGEEDTKLIFINFGENVNYSLGILKSVREAGIGSLLYPSAARIKKQMAFANARNIPFVAIAGPDEVKKEKVLLKNMLTGDQELISPDDLIEKIKS